MSALLFTCGERLCYQYDLHTDTFRAYNGNVLGCSEDGNLNKLLHERKVKFPASKKLSMMNGVIFLYFCNCYTYFRWAQILERLFQFIFHVVFSFPATFQESGRDIHLLDFYVSTSDKSLDLNCLDLWCTLICGTQVDILNIIIHDQVHGLIIHFIFRFLSRHYQRHLVPPPSESYSQRSWQPQSFAEQRKGQNLRLRMCAQVI